MDYCFECPEYPCTKYDHIDERDSLISHRNQLSDMEKARCIGIDAYRSEQRTKAILLHRLIDNYDDGRRDVFFCLASNMLEVDDLRKTIERADAATSSMEIHDKSDFMERELRCVAAETGVPLELRQWDGPW